VAQRHTGYMLVRLARIVGGAPCRHVRLQPIPPVERLLIGVAVLAVDTVTRSTIADFHSGFHSGLHRPSF
jgi:hypothetical protein